MKAWVAKTPAQDSDVTPCGSQVANYDFGRPDFTTARHAGSHRLNAQPIPVHQAHAYTYRAHWTGHGPYTLRVLMINGTQRSISA